MKTLDSASKTIGLVASFAVGAIALLAVNGTAQTNERVKRRICSTCENCPPLRDLQPREMQISKKLVGDLQTREMQARDLQARDLQTRDYAVHTLESLDLPSNTTRDICPENQRFVYTKPSANYAEIRDGSLHAIDVINGYKTLIDFEFRRIKLSSVECEVAHCLLQSMTYKNIGLMVSLGESAIKTHVGNIFKKARCGNREEFAQDIYKRLASSMYSWRSRRDLEHDMERMLQL